MIKGMIGYVGKLSRDAAIMVIGIYTLVWATGRLKEVFNPMAFYEAQEAKISQSEVRSKELIHSEISKERSIAEAEHREVMSAVSGISERTKRIEVKMDTLLERKTAVLSTPARDVD